MALTAARGGRGRVARAGIGRGRVWLVAALVGAAGCATPAWAQLDEVSPVYVANAPFAEEVLETVDALLARGGVDEAVRLIQRVLEEQGDRMIGSSDPEVFVSVRERVHGFVASDPPLLEAYRVRQSPRARTLLSEGAWAQVARSYWLTPAGFEAGLRDAQSLIESGSFRAGLRALDRLLGHPDARDAAMAIEAGALAATGAAYVGTEPAWAGADRWAELAGAPMPERRAVPRPESRRPAASHTLAWDADAGAGGPVSLEGVVPRALHAAPLTELDPADEPEQPTRGGMQRAELGWTLPTLAGGDLFTNDGLTLTCFDRFTLRPKWRVRDTSPNSEDGSTRLARLRLGRMVEDSGSVTVHGDRVYAALGQSRTGADESVGRVVCVDRSNGRVLWSVLLGGLSEDLLGSEPRGPLVIEGDQVIVGARKNLRSRRLVSLSLLSLDADTGALRWSRALGSAGSLPFQQLTQLSEGGVLRDGVVYWTDKMGLVGAVETATGRVLWVRQTRAPGIYTRGARTPYTTSLPVINDHGLFLLTPDQTRLLRLEPDTGRLLGSRVAEPANEATYLIGVGERIVSVGATRIAVYEADRFDSGVVHLSAPLDDRGIRGRVVAAGDRVAVPVGAGLAMVDIRGSMTVEPVPLDATGNVVLSDGQVVVTDEIEARSFLSWATASAMLERRVADGDFEAALALAELAHRSGRDARVVGAIDDAVRLVRAADDAGRSRDRVFEAVRALADPQAGSSAVGVAVRGELLARMGAVARTNEQRVAHAMATGAWRAASGDAPGAADAYQDVLLEPAWSRSIWRGGGLSVRAELEATRRLHELADRYGARAMAMPDRMAEAEIAALNAGGTGAQWETVARRYPASRMAPLAWARAAAGWLREERWTASERAARSGLRAASMVARRSQPLGEGTLGELVGALMSSLASQGLPDAAADALAEQQALFGERFGAIVPTVGGRAVALSPAETMRRYAAVGPMIDRAERALIPGSPVAAMVEGAPGLVLMYARQTGELAAYASEALASSAAGAAPPEALWSVSDVGTMPPVLVHTDGRTLTLAWPDELQTGRPARVESRDARSGAVRWEANVRAAMDMVDAGADPAVRLNGQIVAPLEGPVSNAHLLVAGDARSVVVSDRLGRAAGVDATDGRVLWQRRLGVTRLYGLDLRGGVLGVCGVVSRAPDGQNDEIEDASLRGVGEAVDARTGETIQLLDDLGAETRWVRVATDGQVIVGASGRIVAMDTVAGRIDWSNADEELVDSMDAWVHADTLVVLGQDRMLWPVSRREGLRSGTPMDTLGRGGDRGFVSVERRPFGLVVPGSAGVTTHTSDGALVAADAMDVRLAFVLHAVGQRRAVLVDRGEVDADGLSRVGVAIVDAETGRTEDRVTLTLPEGVRRTATRVGLADGVVVVGFGEVSVVLAVPGGEG